jgi:hypothetical protein
VSWVCFDFPSLINGFINNQKGNDSDFKVKTLIDKKISDVMFLLDFIMLYDE